MKSKMKSKNRVKIVGDGTPWGTDVIVNGVSLKDVLVSVEVTKISINKAAKIILEIRDPEIDLDMDPELVELVLKQG